jgi:hypothetical protein
LYSIHDLQKEIFWSDPMASIQIKKSHVILQKFLCKKTKNCIKLGVILKFNSFKKSKHKNNLSNFEAIKNKLV